MRARLLYKIPSVLGEGPLWHSERNSIFWVDIEGQCIFELKWPRLEFTELRIGHRVSLIVPGNKDRLILGLQGGIAGFDLGTQVLEWLFEIEKDLPKNRSNDGATDKNGRLWIGTMDLDFKPNAGSLYCIEKGLLPRKEIEGVTISNGLAWSPGNTRAYYIDSPTQTIRSYFFNLDEGRLSFEKVAVHIPKELGTPDGMCIDEEGMLWVAHWGGFAVYRWNPTNGEWIDKIELSVPNVSSCVFGGKDLDHLVITTARQNLTVEELKRYPDSGSLFISKLKVKGTLVYPCNL